jgi:spore coat protein U-like protein
MRRLAHCAALWLALVAFPVHAAHSCVVSVGTLNFGVYAGLQISSSSTMTVTCTLTSGIIETVNYTAALSTGASGTYTQRRLTNLSLPADTLPYNLYQGTVPAALNTNVWGDGTGGTTTASGSFNLIVIFAPVGNANYTVAGAIAAVAAVPAAGTYNDTIIATLTFN